MSKELILSGNGDPPSDQAKLEKWLRRFFGLCSVTTIIAVGSIASAFAAWYGQIQLAKQFESSTADYQHEQFSKSIGNLNQLLRDLYDASPDGGQYDPVVLLARKSGLVMSLSETVSSNRSFVVDEIETARKPHQFMIRLQGELQHPIVCGGNDLVYEAVSNGADFLTAYQRAKRLEKLNPDKVLSSEYLTLSRFAFAFAGISEANEYLNKAVAATETQEDGPSKALMNAEIAAIKVMYQKGDDQDEGRRLFRQAEASLHVDDAAGAAVCLVDLYHKWAVAEHHVRNRDAADAATEKLFSAIDALPARQTTKNRYVLNATAGILSEMNLANGTLAEIPLPEVFRMRDQSAQWKTLSVADVGNDFSRFDHQRLRSFDGGGTVLVMRPAMVDPDLSPVPVPVVDSGTSVLTTDEFVPQD